MTATKEQIIRFIEQRLDWAEERPEDAITYFHQALGAVWFYIDNLDGYSDEWDSLWDPYRQKFLELLLLRRENKWILGF